MPTQTRSNVWLSAFAHLTYPSSQSRLRTWTHRWGWKLGRGENDNKEMNKCSEVQRCSLASLYLLFLPPPHDLTSRSYSSTSFEDAMKKAEEPPTPPPRPQKTHSRASSLDLNKLFQQGVPGTIHSHRLPLSSQKFRNTHSLRAWTTGAEVHFTTELLCCVYDSSSFMGEQKGEMEIGRFYCSAWKLRVEVGDYESMGGLFFWFKERNVTPESNIKILPHWFIAQWYFVWILGVKSGWLQPPPALPPRPSTSQVCSPC